MKDPSNQAKLEGSSPITGNASASVPQVRMRHRPDRHVQPEPSCGARASRRNPSKRRPAAGCRAVEWRRRYFPHPTDAPVATCGDVRASSARIRGSSGESRSAAARSQSRTSSDRMAGAPAATCRSPSRTRSLVACRSSTKPRIARLATRDAPQSSKRAVFSISVRNSASIPCVNETDAMPADP